MNRSVVLLSISALMFMFSSAHAVKNTTADAKYCIASGGQVENMVAEISTRNGLVKGQSRAFCTFYPDNGFVAVGLETFSDPRPSIAATFMKKMPEIQVGSTLWKGSFSNPSHNVCKNVGGSSIGFVANGGFSNSLGQSDICVFGDGSMVSAWSLIYMTNHRDGYDRIKNKVKAVPLSIHIPS